MSSNISLEFSREANNFGMIAEILGLSVHSFNRHSNSTLKKVLSDLPCCICGYNEEGVLTYIGSSHDMIKTVLENLDNNFHCITSYIVLGVQNPELLSKVLLTIYARAYQKFPDLNSDMSYQQLADNLPEDDFTVFAAKLLFCFIRPPDIQSFQVNFSRYTVFGLDELFNLSVENSRTIEVETIHHIDVDDPKWEETVKAFETSYNQRKTRISKSQHLSQEMKIVYLEELESEYSHFFEKTNPDFEK
ncbi:MAG: hypothetical protein JXR95_14595 [Deltaproteobacteria bacterium]|nr:hypothetical protein [Deltaproteobacteria bacterium]